VRATSVKFIDNATFNAEEHLRNVIGVTIKKDALVEHILLKFSPDRAP